MKYVRVEFYLPFVQETQEAYSAALARLCTSFGGVTTEHEAYGWWRSPSTGELVQEDVNVVTVFAEDTPETRLTLHAIAEEFKRDAHQEQVLYVLNLNDVQFV